MSKLSNLLKTASEKNWCTKLFCTTCGALDFRRELKKQSTQELLDGLRALSLDSCLRHSEALRLIFVEIALLPTCYDLREPLANTAAGEVLESAIRHSKEIQDRRRQHEQWSSPEAAKERQIARKSENEVAHRLRLSQKAEFERALATFRDAIDQSDFECFFKTLRETEDRMTARAVGGLAYAVLRDRLRNGELGIDELSLLEKCASSFGGHWAKLVKTTPKVY